VNPPAGKITVEELCERYLKTILHQKLKTIEAKKNVVIGACSNRLVPVVLREWRGSKHEQFHERNVWSLFNAFTEALKGNLIELPRRTEALHGLLDTHVGLAPPILN